MKRLTIVLCILVLSLTLVAPVLAEEPHECSHDGATLESLRMCLEHAVHHGHIDSAGVQTSLLAKVSAAEAAVARGQTPTAISILNALAQEIAAQSGKHIAAEHAAHLLEHTQRVIDGLSQP